MMTRLLFLATAVVIATPLHGQTPEVEPNDSPATATKVALGATAAGVITRIDALTRNPDWWTFDATAGDSLRFEFDGAWVDLFAEDGKTRLVDPRDPAIYYVVTKTGRYFLRASTFLGGDQYYEIGLWTNRHPKPPCEVANDREPNDIPAIARVVAFSERVDGILCDYEDTDYFRFHATRRMRVQIRIDRDTGSKPSSWGNPYVIVGNDRTDYHWNSDWRNGAVLEMWVPEDADYVAAVSTSDGTQIKYSLTVLDAGTVPTGPGEPAVPRADNMGSPVGFAVAPNGDMYVSDWDRHIWKVTPAGQKSLWINDVQHSPNSLAFDAAGNLLVLSWSRVHKVSPTGDITPLVTTGSSGFLGDFEAIAVARDSTIWISTGFGQIKHFDRDGQFLDSTSVLKANPKNPYGLGHLAFAPDGTLYFVAGDGIFRLVSGAPELFVRDTAGVDQPDGSMAIAGFTFDVEGNLYVTHPYSGGITRYDRTGAEIEKPYAWIPAAPRAIAFGRNPDGSTNRRLFVLANTNYQHLPSPLNGTIFELHSNEVDPPPPQITVEDAIAELLHPGRLSAEQLATLDQRGNANGRYDVGDLRAFLVANGGLARSQARRP